LTRLCLYAGLTSYQRLHYDSDEKLARAFPEGPVGLVSEWWHLKKVKSSQVNLFFQPTRNIWNTVKPVK
jgi:hypothetical protein